jgi:hypothetical protein
MSSFPAENYTPLALKVKVNEGMLEVFLTDGRIVSVPLEWFPKLRKARKEELERWSLIGNGIGIHWDDLDEDLSVEGLLH